MNENAEQGRRGRLSISRRKFLGASAVAGAVAAIDPFALTTAGAAPSTIADENAKAGTDPSVWDVDEWEELQGFASPYSVNAGSRVDFKVKTTCANYKIEVYRIGWYGGKGARLITTVPISVPLPQPQPQPYRDAATGMCDCGNWNVTASWNVPATAVSGIYMANLVAQDGSGWQNRMQFVVRNDGRVADILVQTSDSTYQAYNQYGDDPNNPFSGGNSLYFGTAGWGRAVQVSYNRPLWGGALENTFMYAELPLVRWLERNGYDVAYCGDVDSHARPAELLNKKVFISHGHDEYWSGQQRTNVEAARDAGVHLIFMTGNECFWKIRYENSFDGTNTPNRTITCYKDTLVNAKIDPSSDWTGTWRDTRFGGPGRPENGLTGTLFRAINPNESEDFSIKVPYAYSRLRVWRNTSVASLQPGQTATLAAGSLGYEWNTDEPNAARPAGLVRLSETTETADQVLQDAGGTYITAPLTHYMTTYRAPSGALVWSTGTVQWCWGLDEYHRANPDLGTPADPRMQQATLNMLADMGVQPMTRQAGLVAATASTDTVPPVSQISSPAPGASVTIGTNVTISGTATDTGGGRVAAVEVSVDGGTTWRAASGTSSWTYTFMPTSLGSISIRSRAIDDSNNMETPGAGRTLVGAPRPYPLSIWPTNAVPGTPSTTDPTPLELGVRFRSSVEGFVTGIRFYKGAGNTGTHTGTLWTNAGVQLAKVTFQNETASGWQTALFATPVAIAANTTYVASYFTPSGNYASDTSYFGQDFVLPPLRALANGADGANGVYLAGSSGFPFQTFGASNYWVDVIFDIDDHKAPTVVDRSPASGVSAVALNEKVRATFSEAMTGSSIAIEVKTGGGTVVAGTVGYDAPTRTATFTPTSPLAPTTTYTATVTAAQDAAGSSITAPVSWTFKTSAPVGGFPATLWDSSAVPAILDTQDPNELETGVAFRSDIDGLVTAIRFYKGPADTGAHTGRIWAADGTALGTVQFSNESASGWQEARFATPVEVAKATTYVAAVHSMSGNPAATGGYFGTDHSRGVLHAPAETGPFVNALFKYGAPGLPTNNWGRTNYWVDLVMEPGVDESAPTIVDKQPAAGVHAVVTSSAVTATFSEAIAPASLSLTLKRGATNVAGSVSYSAATVTATFTPTAALAADTTYTATVNATDAVGNELPTTTWSFHTKAAPGASPATIWDSSAVPTNVAVADGDSVELGTKFRAAADGAITAIRFYKGPGNDGPHVGRLWTAAGTLLGTAVFDDESRVGWQEASFESSIPVTANTTYVASYLAPNGHYSLNGGGFNAGVDNPPLHALGNGVDGGNGVFAYGPGGFPTSSFGASNYWVDVVYTGGPSAARVTTTTPAANATGVPLGVAPSGTLDRDVTASTVAIALEDATGAAVPGSGAYNASNRSATFTPAAALADGSVYTVTISGATTPDGAVMTPARWSFTTVGATPTGGGQAPAAGATNVAPTSTVSLVSSQPLQPSTIVFELRTPTNAVVPGTTGYDAGTRRVTFTPTAPLAEGTTYSARLVSATSTQGVSMNPVTWTFSTVPAPVSVFAANATPATTQVSSASSIEVGMKFRSTVNGQVLGVRFYKGAANTGTHVGHLWSSSGTLLATVTFTGETASGWQTARFSKPVNITANTTYVVSYLAPVGRYSQTYNGFAAEQGTGQVRGNRSTLLNRNGVYRSTTTGAFPNNGSLTSNNYWVDVLFRAT